MIIRNSYNKLNPLFEQSTRRIKQLILIALLGCGVTFKAQAQDSIPQVDAQLLKKKLDFQELFFSAITDKAIQNYQKAITALEKCNELVPNDIAVLFELSKNYHFLNRYVPAVNYAEQALALDPKNLWIAEHLVKVYRNHNAFDKAVSLQKKIIANYPKKKGDLVYLYLRKNDLNNAKLILEELKTAKLLSPRLRRIHNQLMAYQKKRRQAAVPSKKSGDLVAAFEKDSSFKILKPLLTKLDSAKDAKLLAYSEKGLSLYPAQPFVYLMHAKALYRNKKYKNALESLENGIDFVIDNPNMLKDFYKEFVKNYQRMGNAKKASFYKKKL